MAETKLNLKQLQPGGAVTGQVLWFIEGDWLPGSVYLPHVIRAGISQGKPNPNVEFARYKAGALIYVSEFSVLGFPAIMGTCRVNPTSNAVFTIKRNGSAYATCTFNTDGTTTVAWQGSNWDLGPDDILSFHTPVTQDPTLLDVSITLTGKVQLSV